ncbi:hypothetical protein LSH36_168g04015 [Paralvinella palmiformis]|uniref:Uncharacterized protein n=1 Tax=Paralvinella palmiformis TaxID=53620 RepID=A0AAD9N663_9ANNE|nr:hypothetical protein LSH36_168g04015 [Paralvinella palmiformis]
MADDYTSNARLLCETTKTWNNLPTNHIVIHLTLVSHEGEPKLLMKAPFFNDSPAGEPFLGLEKYEDNYRF